MTATERKRIRLGSETHRKFVGSLVASMPAGYVVTIDPPRRTLDQNAIFHAICGEVAKSGIEWGGCERSAEEWKALFVVSHAIATGRGIEVVPNLENGAPMPLRESSARMTKERMSSLIDYVTSWCAQHGVTLRDWRDE